MPKSDNSEVGANNKNYVVYKVCLINPDDSHVEIKRFLGVDEEGILEIGETGDIETRKKDFNRGSSSHSAGKRLERIKQYSNKYNKLYNNHKAKFYIIKTVSSEEEAMKEEARLQKCYFTFDVK
jgi:hypothetical protein